MQFFFSFYRKRDWASGKVRNWTYTFLIPVSLLCSTLSCILGGIAQHSVFLALLHIFQISEDSFHIFEQLYHSFHWPYLLSLWFVACSRHQRGPAPPPAPPHEGPAWQFPTLCFLLRSTRFLSCSRFIPFYKIIFLIRVTIFSFITFLAGLEPTSGSSLQWKPHNAIIILNQGMGKIFP